ncbi:Rib/alpha-like domain-containing protein, partial [Gemella haemolysans]|uniref:Rib/alpha-like domain-containing protein n=1 Tax=Gemella haemolysans TaxID=1379 RepID=UPI00290D203B
MLFNRHGLQQKNWRMVKKGKHILFGCSLFFVVGGASISGSQVVHASEINASRVVEEKVVANNTSSEISAGEASTLDKKQVSEASNDKKAEKIKQTQDVEKPAEKKEQKENLIGESGEKPLVKKEVNKKELKDLVDKIKKTDISKKTEKLVKELNLILSRAEEALDNKETTQEEIDKEVKALKEVFEKLEDKPKEDKKSEAKEKAESKKEEKSNVEKNTKEKQQENTTEDVARKHNEKITKVTETVTEINSIANQINYEFSDAEKELVKTAEKLPTFYNSDKYNEETIQKLLKEVIYLRNKVANRMTRVHSGKRDPRNGKVIENSGESTFRGIRFTPLENTQNGKVVSNADTNLTYFNSDSFWIKTQVKGEKFRHDSANTYYLVKKVTLSGKPFKDLSIIVSTGKGDRRASTTIDNINNPNVQAGILGNLGTNGIITPGNYQVVLTVNDTVSPGNNYNIIYNITIKPQSERNTVRDLTPTYVDDVRHLTEAEKTALIEKFKTEHPDVVNRAQHIDFDHAEISSDGTTMTVHFKDGLSTKTIQTNAQNDVVAKYPSLTTLVGDPHEFYKNPRNLVKSKTNHEVPQTARVTWKTPFDFSQPGTKNAVVTVSYDNGVTKDVTTPYTVLDFIGKQDKSINQNQSGELGDARSYITLSNDTAPATDLTIRWKGGSSVDTSAQGTQRKEIEILRGNTVMKTVTIPVAIVDDIKPTITAPDSVLLTRAEGLPSNISIDAQDNARGIGLKDTNQIAVENLANPLRYNPSTKRIELSGVIPNNFQRTQATIKAVDKNGNTATKTITFNVQAQTDKYNAVANPQKQTVSYHARPDAGSSVNKNGLPAGTTYTWATTPSTTTGPGDKAGVVTVSYPDGSTDTVNVTIAVRKLSDEHEPTGTKIVRNQNVPVTNNDLKAAVNVNNNGNSKVKSVTPVSSISTANAGMQTIRATVTYLDNTTDFVDIPLEVKDVTAPTIQTPSDRQNWDLIALDRTLPSIKVAATDNLGGSGIKSTTVTGLPDFSVYDEATKTIKFKNGVQEVIKLPVGQDSKTYNATIQVTDNANNPSQRQITITVKSMTTKYNATPSGQKQTVSYGVTPDAGTSINKNGLPAGTRYTWATTPSTTTGPGDKAGVVTVTYPDDSIDTVNVTVNVRRLADEYVPTGTKITREQNTAVTNDDLKAAVTISNNGNNKVKSVTPAGTISTAEFGNKTINATVTYLDDTTDSVTIPLEVRDVTKPTIQTPTDRQNWDLIALDRTLPEIKVAATDNPGGSGIKSTTVTGLPNFLTYDEATKTIKFKNGVQEVTKLPEGTDVQTHNITITVTDNANNSNSAQVTITVKSMTTKYDATANSEKQTVSYGDIPDAGTSVNKTNLPAGTTYTWATTPSTTTGPGDKAGVVTVKYPDGSKDTVNVTVNVRALNDEYNLTATEIVVNQNDQISNDRLKTVVSATSKVGNVNGTDKISTVTAPTINTASYGSQNITATVTFKDRTVKEVTIPIKVKDVTKPTISAPGENTNWEITALDKALPNMEVRAEDNANGSGIKSVSVTGLPDYLEYDKTTNSIKFKAGKQEVEKLPVNTPSKEFTLKIRAEDNAGNVSEKVAKITVYSMSEKNTPTPLPQTVDNGQVPKAEESVNKTGLPEGTTVTWKTTP